MKCHCVMRSRYPLCHLQDALGCQTALEMPKLSKAAYLRTEFDLVTISVLLKGKWFFLKPCTNFRKILSIGTFSFVESWKILPGRFSPLLQTRPHSPPQCFSQRTCSSELLTLDGPPRGPSLCRAGSKLPRR